MKKTIVLMLLIVAGICAVLYFAGVERREKDSRGTNVEQIYQVKVKRIQAQRDSLLALVGLIQERRYKDSVHFSERLKSSKEEIQILKAKYAAITLQNASVQFLDSLGRVLYPDPFRSVSKSGTN